MIKVTKTFWAARTKIRYYLPALVALTVLVIFIFWVLGRVIFQTVVGPKDQALLLKSQTLATQDNINNGRVLAAQTGSNSNWKITAVPGQTIQQRYVLKDGQVQPIFVFNTQYPKFIGITNTEHSLAYLDIYGSNHVTGNSKIDANGNWEWQANVPIQPGTYLFNVRAVDEDTREELAKDSMLFEVVLDKGELPQKVDLNNIPQEGNNGTLFDVRVSVPAGSKAIQPGMLLPADIKLVNIGTPTKSVDVEVQYTIRNEDDEVVSEQSETVAVKKELTYSKNFYTASSLPDGNYKLTVAIPSRDLIATASDSFKIQKNADLGASNTKKTGLPVNNVIIQIVGAAIFMGILIAYMEFTRVTTLYSNAKKITGREVLK